MSGIVMALLGAAMLVPNPLPIPDIENTVIDPADASCSVSFNSDGTASRDGLGAPVAFNWFSGAPATGIGNGYWIRLQVNSGNAPTSGSSVGSILQLSATRSWTLTRTMIGTLSGNYTIQIFTDAGGVNMVSSTTFQMTSTVDF